MNETHEALPKATVRKLKSLAQRLDPMVKLGKAGVTDGFVASLKTALEQQELVKIRFDDHADQRKVLAPEIATKTGSQLIWIVGHVAVFFRQHPDPAKRKVQV
jgi:RNA-binding protein